MTSVNPMQPQFTLHSGEMGNRWGINRTLGQIDALLYLSESALRADDIVRALGISRSNDIIGTKERESPRLVCAQQQPNDRLEYYRTPEDIWENFRILIEERRKREIDERLTMLREAAINTSPADADCYAAARMREMLNGLATRWLDDVSGLSPKTAVKLTKLGGKVSQMIGFAAGESQQAERTDSEGNDGR